MRKDAAPGPDGFTPLFHQANWALMQHVLLQLMNDFQAGVAEMHRINKAYLALQPKKSASILPKDYRPISLQKSSYIPTELCHQTLHQRDDSAPPTICAATCTLRPNEFFQRALYR
jgi:hypothetical protein